MPADLYFIESPSTSLIKIGSSRNTERRLRYMISHSPCSDLRILQVLEGESHLERSVHTMWAEYRSHGEWFLGTDELRSWIDRGCPMNERREPKTPEGDTIGALIRNRREALGLTRLQLSQQLDPPVNPQTIYIWETGRRWPGEKRLANLATVLGGKYEAPRFVFRNKP